MTLYGRRIVVEVAGFTISEPRITVTVDKPADAAENTGKVEIYNLNPSTAEHIYRRGTSIRIDAGYPETIATIFAGQCQRIRRPRKHLAHITEITLGDETRAPERLGGTSTFAYAGLVDVRSIFSDIVRQDMGLFVGPLTAIPASAQLQDYSFTGISTDALTDVLSRVSVVDTDALGDVESAPRRLYWYEDDGVVRVRRVGETQADRGEIYLSPDSGLVGAAEPTEEGVECTMFLNPLVQRGSTIILDSEAASGRFNVVALRHDADNWAVTPFISWVDLRAIETETRLASTVDTFLDVVT